MKNNSIEFDTKYWKVGEKAGVIQLYSDISRTIEYNSSVFTSGNESTDVEEGNGKQLHILGNTLIANSAAQFLYGLYLLNNNETYNTLKLGADIDLAYVPTENQNVNNLGQEGNETNIVFGLENYTINIPSGKTIDGVGYTISNFNAGNTEYRIVLNGGSTLKNVVLQNWSSNSSLIDAATGTNNTLTNVHAIDCVVDIYQLQNGSETKGALVNGIKGTMTNCSYTGKFNYINYFSPAYDTTSDSTYILGGLIGSLYGGSRVDQCWYDGKITSYGFTQARIGGLVGYAGVSSTTSNKATISNSYIISTINTSITGGGSIGSLAYTTENTNYNAVYAAVTSNNKSSSSTHVYQVGTADTFKFVRISSNATSVAPNTTSVTGTVVDGSKMVYQDANSDGLADESYTVSGTKYNLFNSTTDDNSVDGTTGYNYVSIWGHRPDINNGYPYLLKGGNVFTVTIDYTGSAGSYTMKVEGSSTYNKITYENADKVTYIVPYTDDSAIITFGVGSDTYIKTIDGNYVNKSETYTEPTNRTGDRIVTVQFATVAYTHYSYVTQSGMGYTRFEEDSTNNSVSSAYDYKVGSNVKINFTPATESGNTGYYVKDIAVYDNLLTGTSVTLGSDATANYNSTLNIYTATFDGPYTSISVSNNKLTSEGTYLITHKIEHVANASSSAKTVVLAHYSDGSTSTHNGTNYIAGGYQFILVELTARKTLSSFELRFASDGTNTTDKEVVVSNIGIFNVSHTDNKISSDNTNYTIGGDKLSISYTANDNTNNKLIVPVFGYTYKVSVLPSDAVTLYNGSEAAGNIIANNSYVQEGDKVILKIKYTHSNQISYISLNSDDNKVYQRATGTIAGYTLGTETSDENYKYITLTFNSASTRSGLYTINFEARTINVKVINNYKDDFGNTGNVSITTRLTNASGTLKGTIEGTTTSAKYTFSSGQVVYLLMTAQSRWKVGSVQVNGVAVAVEKSGSNYVATIPVETVDIEIKVNYAPDYWFDANSTINNDRSAEFITANGGNPTYEINATTSNRTFSSSDTIGTMSNPFKIANAKQFVRFAYLVNTNATYYRSGTNNAIYYKDSYYDITANIDLSDYYMPTIGIYNNTVAEVAGISSSTNSTISNVYIYEYGTHSTNTLNIATFIYQVSDSVSNINFTNINVTSDKEHISGLLGYANNGVYSNINLTNVTLNSAEETSTASVFSAYTQWAIIKGLGIYNPTFNNTNIGTVNAGISQFAGENSYIVDSIIYGFNVSNVVSYALAYQKSGGDLTLNNVVFHLTYPTGNTPNGENLIGSVNGEDPVWTNIYVYTNGNIQFTFPDSVRTENLQYVSSMTDSSQFNTLDFYNIWYMGSNYPMPKHYASTAYTTIGSSQAIINSLHEKSANLQGAGSLNEPYQIYTANDLYKLADIINSGDSIATYNANTVYYKLMNDIDLSGYLWNPIGNESYPFKANFDGDNHTIRNINIYAMNNPQGYYGLFGYINNSTISNLRISNANYYGQAAGIGGVVGRMVQSRINNVVFDGSIYTKANYVGGIVSYIEFYANNYNEIVRTGVTHNSRIITMLPNAVGGIVGYIVLNSTTSYAGTNLIQYSYVEGIIKSYQKDGNATGGILGGMSASTVNAAQLTIIADCYVTGTLYTSNITGGIAGIVNNALIINNYFAGKIVTDAHSIRAYASGDSSYWSNGSQWTWDSEKNVQIAELVGYAAQQNSIVINNTYLKGTIYITYNDETNVNTSSNNYLQLPMGSTAIGSTEYGVSGFASLTYTPRVIYLMNNKSYSSTEFTKTINTQLVQNNPMLFIDASVNNGYPAYKWAHYERVLINTMAEVKYASSTDEYIGNKYSYNTTNKKYGQSTGSNTPVEATIYAPHGDTYEITLGTIKVINATIEYDGSIYVKAGTTFTYDLIPDENYVVEINSYRTHYNAGTSRLDTYHEISDDILATYTNLSGTSQEDSVMRYSLTINEDTDLYAQFKNDVFDVIFNVKFVTANGVSINTSKDYLNIVVYNSDNNKAYFEHVTASASVSTITFSGLNGGNYCIGVYESMFYDIVGSGDVSYKVGTNASVTMDSGIKTHYTVELNNDLRGIVITVVVTKEYNNWLYS